MPEQGKQVPTRPAAPVEAEAPSRSATRAALDEIVKRLERTEKTTGRSGAISRTPKARMFDIEALKKANPDKHYRYVNTDNIEKSQGRVEDGYKAVSEEECEAHGARSEIGSSRLMEIPRERYEERVREIKKVTESRLKAHRTDVRAAAEAVSKELRDRHGINLPVERLFLDE